MGLNYLLELLIAMKVEEDMRKSNEVSWSKTLLEKFHSLVPSIFHKVIVKHWRKRNVEDKCREVPNVAFFGSPTVTKYIV